MNHYYPGKQISRPKRRKEKENPYTIAAVKTDSGTHRFYVSFKDGGEHECIIVICMVGLIAGSCYGIFFADEDTGSELTLRSVMQGIDAEYQRRIDEIIATVPHDTVEIVGEPAPWNEVLVIYAVKTTTDPAAPQEVVTMDYEKAKILWEVYWDMTQIVYATEVLNSVASVGGNTQLTITVSPNLTEKVINGYGFDPSQKRYIEELCFLLKRMV